jgi:hypothetical protein
MASSGDLKLFQKISVGKEEAFAAIFHPYTPLLFPFIKSSNEMSRLLKSCRIIKVQLIGQKPIFKMVRKQD